MCSQQYWRLLRFLICFTPHSFTLTLNSLYRRFVNLRSSWHILYQAPFQLWHGCFVAEKRAYTKNKMQRHLEDERRGNNPFKNSTQKLNGQVPKTQFEIK